MLRRVETMSERVFTKKYGEKALSRVKTGLLRKARFDPWNLKVILYEETSMKE